MSQQPIGGGVKKVLYTLQTVREIGVGRATKALNAKNACKACAFGMGGQMGGMTNEEGEFPSVCNKSVQAQSTDIQPAIPADIFGHTLEELRELDAREFEHLGRLGSPILKSANENKYRVIEWGEALNFAAARLRSADPERTFFYSSGRSSNEAGFLFQLFARAYGTNNVSNCSYYCHQATSVALGQTIGKGTATVELADLALSDLIFVIGANPSSNHPRFIHSLKACRDRGGHVVVINPAKEPGLVKFAVPKSPTSLLAGGSEIASVYLQPRIGEDVMLFTGMAKAILEAGFEDNSFIDRHTVGYDEFAARVKAAQWGEIVDRCGVPEETIKAAAGVYGRATSAVFSWGMGMTHHVHGVENIEYISNLALLRGMIGRPGAGLLPLRGHSNVQGVGTIGVKPVLPDDVIEKMEDAFGVSFPKRPGLDTMASMQAADTGRIDAAVLMGGNLFAANPDAAWAERALGKIKFRLNLTTTLNHSHVRGVDGCDSLVLPVTARDEEWEPTTQESMFNFVRLSDGGIRRLANVRPETAILADLASRVLGDCPIDFQVFKRHRKLRQAIAEIVPGMEALADIDVAKKEFHVKNRILHTPVFATTSKRAHFQTHSLASDWSAPFKLTTMRSEGQFNSIIYEYKDAYRGTDTRWSVLMNSDDMAALGLSHGDKAHIRSAQGRMEDVKVFPFDIPRRCVMAYYPEANVLTNTAVDPRSKTPSFKATPVWIEAA
jgi:molybdopterin-dependent oxidoreductase alpha subunit